MQDDAKQSKKTLSNLDVIQQIDAHMSALALRRLQSHAMQVAVGQLSRARNFPMVIMAFDCSVLLSCQEIVWPG